MQWTAEQAQAVVNTALSRAATDGEFRKLALADANAAVEQVAGQPLPEGFRVRVLEREGFDITLVLRDPVVDGELSDSELERVAGGARQANLATWIDGLKGN
jgi:hypothetical protein